MKGVAPLPSIAEATISQAALKGPAISSSSFSNISKIITDRLDIMSERENGLSDVYVKGSLLVQGSIQGSGPYIDNSDSRLKRDVKNVTGVLPRVLKLQGVSLF